MKTPAPADLQRWTEEVARDSASLAFLPLARAYRRMGRREAALQLCLRGLEHYPQHAEGHALLALLYLERGERARAADEWSIVLRLDPNNFEALRGLGFSYLEQDQLSRARQTLERAALLRPSDAAVQEALRLLGTRQELHAAPPAPPESAPAAGPEPGATGTPLFSFAETPAVEAVLVGDPARVFSQLAASGPMLGVLLLDRQGLVLAGGLSDAAHSEAETLGAVLGGAVGDAQRAATHLALGGWGGLLLETEHALLHLAPAARDSIVVVAARRGAPVGWVMRAATQAGEIAGRYLEMQR